MLGGVPLSPVVAVGGDPGVTGRRAIVAALHSHANARGRYTHFPLSRQPFLNPGTKSKRRARGERIPRDFKEQPEELVADRRVVVVVCVGGPEPVVKGTRRRRLLGAGTQR